MLSTTTFRCRGWRCLVVWFAISRAATCYQRMLPCYLSAQCVTIFFLDSSHKGSSKSCFLRWWVCVQQVPAPFFLSQFFYWIVSLLATASDDASARVMKFDATTKDSLLCTWVLVNIDSAKKENSCSMLFRKTVWHSDYVRGVAWRAKTHAAPTQFVSTSWDQSIILTNIAASWSWPDLTN